jgi:hypothetical protein
MSPDFVEFTIADEEAKRNLASFAAALEAAE